MKQVTKNTMIALGLFVISAFNTTLKAQTETGNPGIELKLAGSEFNQPLIDLNIPNARKELYFINITDQNDEVLYSETVKGENIYRRFRLNTYELNGSVLQISITTRKAARPTIFQVKLSEKLVREASVISFTE